MARRLLALLSLSVLVSCSLVNTTPSLGEATAPDEKLGYVAGRFLFTGPSGWGGRLAFEVQPAEGESLHFGFGEPRAQGAWEIRMIPVPPGVYRVASWVAYDSYGKEANREPYDALGSFVVRPGHVVFLGTFRANMERTTQITRQGGRLRQAIQLRWSFRPDQTRADEATSSLRSAYARFAAAPVECVLCSAPEPGAASYAEPALTPDKAAAQGIPVPEAAPVPAKGRGGSRSKDVEEKTVPEDRSGVW